MQSYTKNSHMSSLVKYRCVVDIRLLSLIIAAYQLPLGHIVH
jgi:hypothetical protein